MKSIRIACAAIALTGVALGAVAAALSSPDRLLGQSYDRALASAPGANPGPLVRAANAPGSEHFWLTNHARETAHAITPAASLNDSAALADIKKAIATTGSFDAGRIDVIDVQEVPRATLNGQAPASRVLLVTVNVASHNGAEQGLRFVLDVGIVPAAKAANAL